VAEKADLPFTDTGKMHRIALAEQLSRLLAG
jgi:hypothetical protein